MTPLAVFRSWIGVITAVSVIGAAAWLVGEYVHAVRVAPGEKALVESLKERARTDATIHQTLLQPEYDRQRLAFQRRARVYKVGGILLLASVAFFLGWIKWLKPRRGEWAGVPGTVAGLIDALVEDPEQRLAALKMLPKRKLKKGTIAARLKVPDKSLVEYRILDACSGCTVCVQVCPVNAIEARPYQKHEIIDHQCNRCGLCLPACPEQAIEVVSRGVM